MSRIAVVAFSGGLDTSCIVSWLKEDWYGYDEVVAVLVDVGQEFDLEASIERGRAAGADDVVLIDRKDAFAEEQCARAIKTNALYEGKYPLVSALSRPVIAQAVAELAEELGAEAVVHGCTGKGNDQLRFELSFKAHNPDLRVIAPLRDRIWTRDEEIEYALAKGIPVQATQASPFSIDENLFGRAIEAGVLEDPVGGSARGAVRAHRRSCDGARSAGGHDRVRRGSSGGARRRGAAARGADREAERARGPVRDRPDRHDREPRRRDQEPRGLRGAGGDRADPGPLRARGRRADEGRGADQARSRAALDRARLRRPLVHAPPGRRSTRSSTGRRSSSTGEVRVELRPNAAVVTGRRSPHMLYAEQLASYGTGETFPHAAAEGFIKISSLEIELAAARKRAKTKA